jgi:hypothetical protein
MMLFGALGMPSHQSSDYGQYCGDYGKSQGEPRPDSLVPPEHFKTPSFNNTNTDCGNQAKQPSLIPRQPANYAKANQQPSEVDPLYRKTGPHNEESSRRLDAGARIQNKVLVNNGVYTKTKAHQQTSNDTLSAHNGLNTYVN